MSSAEDLALRMGHDLYNEFCAEEQREFDNELDEYDPYEEADALCDAMRGE